jgi:hypothetical protein
MDNDSLLFFPAWASPGTQVNLIFSTHQLEGFLTKKERIINIGRSDKLKVKTNFQAIA